MKKAGLLIGAAFILGMFSSLYADNTKQKELRYFTSDMTIPFWQIMAKGVESKAKELGYKVSVHGAQNSLKTELKNTVEAINSGVEGIILSPINSSSAVTVLELANAAHIPVVISDIGSDKESYVSFISSNNQQGAYDIGKVLTAKMQELGITKGSVGIIAIPQKRANGKARTEGFMRALKEAGIEAAGLRQQVDFTHEETYAFSKQLIQNNPKMKALWLQGSHRYKAALEAIEDMGKKEELLLICFDAEPEFLELIPQGVLVGAAMQQPFLMGEQAVLSMHKHLNDKPVEKNIKMQILAISEKNIEKKLPVIKRNVLGME